jgi:hypothetical protein
LNDNVVNKFGNFNFIAKPFMTDTLQMSKGPIRLSAFEMAETFRFDYQDFLKELERAATLVGPILNNLITVSINF